MRKFSTVELLNSEPLSLQIRLIGSLIRTSIPLKKLMSSGDVSDFSLRMKTQVNLVKSSIITRCIFCDANSVLLRVHTNQFVEVLAVPRVIFQ